MPRPEASAELITSVARLYYQDGLDQHEVAAIAGISRSMVSRLLTTARERGIVRISVDPYEPREPELEQRLRTRFDLRRVVVVKAIGRTVESVRRAIGFFAAPAVAGWLRPRATIGVAGGRTLGALVGSLPSGERAGAVEVVQLMGHIDPAASAMDAPEIGRTLARRLGGSFLGLNVPAFVGDRPTRDLFLAHEHIRLVAQRFDRLDLAFVGIGALEESIFAERGVLHQADFDRLRERGAVGEICGRFFDADGRECASDYRDRVISIELDQLRRRPEVVAVVNGRRRGEAILAALRGGLITSLVVDNVGAEAVLAAAGAAPPAARSGRGDEPRVPRARASEEAVPIASTS